MPVGDISPRAARRIPLASWFRFRRAIETTSTVMLVVEQQPIAGSCSSLLMRLSASGSKLQESKLQALSSQQRLFAVNNSPSHCRLLETLRITVQLERSRLERKPPRSLQTILRTQPVWAVS